MPAPPSGVRHAGLLGPEGEDNVRYIKENRDGFYCEGCYGSHDSAWKLASMNQPGPGWLCDECYDKYVSVSAPGQDAYEAESRTSYGCESKEHPRLATRTARWVAKDGALKQPNFLWLCDTCYEALPLTTEREGFDRKQLALDTGDRCPHCSDRADFKVIRNDVESIVYSCAECCGLWTATIEVTGIDLSVE